MDRAVAGLDVSQVQELAVLLVAVGALAGLSGIGGLSKKMLERAYGAYLLIVGKRFAISHWNGG